MNDERRKICDSVNALVGRRVGDTPPGLDEHSGAVERSPVTSDDDHACPSGFRPNRVDGSLELLSAADTFRSDEETCRFDGSPTSSSGPFAVEARSQDATDESGETAAVRDNGPRERSPTDDDGGDGRTKRSSTARRVGDTDPSSGRGRSAEYGRVPWPVGDQGRPSSSSAADWFADFSDGSADSFATADSRPSSHGHDAAVVPALPAPAERPRQSHCRIV